MTLPRGVVDRRSPELVLSVNVRACFEEDPDALDVAFARGVRQGRRLRVLVGDIDAAETSRRLDEQPEHARVTLARCQVLRPVPCWVREDLGASFEQEPRDRFMSVLTRERERVEVFGQSRLLNRIRRRRDRGWRGRSRFERHARFEERFDDARVPVRD